MLTEKTSHSLVSSSHSGARFIETRSIFVSVTTVVVDEIFKVKFSRSLI